MSPIISGNVAKQILIHKFQRLIRRFTKTEECIFSLKLNQFISKTSVKNKNFKMEESQMCYISVLEVSKCF